MNLSKLRTWRQAYGTRGLRLIVNDYIERHPPIGEVDQMYATRRRRRLDARIGHQHRISSVGAGSTHALACSHGAGRRCFARGTLLVPASSRACGCTPPGMPGHGLYAGGVLPAS